MRGIPAFAAWVMAALLVAATFVSGEAYPQAKAGASDRAITMQVMEELAADPSLGKMDIDVATRSGVVSLTGFVRTMEDIARAGALAGAVSGVSAVTNGLRVANRPSRA
jgi:osmotically-inducible protein OsmY